MNQIKISVIMPVYNTGIYLEEALKTLFAQNFKDFELICIDDSSDDKVTICILNQYQMKYENMQVVRLKHNVGAGKARNIGFSIAQGEYTIFLDADDMFAQDFLEKMYQCICLNKADICVCGYKEFFIEDGNTYFRCGYIPNEYRINSINREDWLLDFPTSAWNKLCRTQFLKENNIFFQSLSSCNDVFFSCMAMINAKKRCFVEDISLIFYRINTKTQISANGNPINLYKAIMSLNDERKKVQPNKWFSQWISALLLRNGIIEIQKCTNEDWNKKAYKLIADFFSVYVVNFQNKMLEVYMENITTIPYENKWIDDCSSMDFLTQLRWTEKKIKEQINDEKQVFLWGLGHRGKLFQKFCKEQGIVLEGVTDIKNSDLGKQTEYGNKIVSTDYVLQSDGLVIACNKKIQEYLAPKKLRMLVLDDFCL